VEGSVRAMLRGAAGGEVGAEGLGATLDRSLAGGLNLRVAFADGEARVLRLRDPAASWEALEVEGTALLGSAFAR
jgi:hypothetical protein